MRWHPTRTIIGVLLGSGFALSAGNSISSAGGTPLPEGFRGVFHLRTGPDALNLQLDDSGWRWTLNGCDSWGEEKGRWELNGTALVLLPEQGKQRFKWMGVMGWYPGPERLELSREPDGNLRVRGITSKEPVDQVLQPGRLCAVCAGDADAPAEPPAAAGTNTIQLAPVRLKSCEGPLPAGSPWDE